MHSRTQLAFVIAVTAAACHRPSPPPDAPSHSADRTVFTDSALHAQKCLPLEPGQDWRRFCTPIDQSAQIVRPKPPQ